MENNNIELTAEEIRELKKVKHELLHNSSATTKSNQRCEDKIIKIAKKYNVDTQVIWDNIP